MFCPVCKSEFVKGIEVCPECKAALVEDAPEAPPSEPEPVFLEMVTILSGEPMEVKVAMSVLKGAGIRCYIKGEGLQDLFGFGRIGTGFNLLVGPVQLQVSKEEAEQAVILLKELPG
jgi:hypothetical protein